MNIVTTTPPSPEEIRAEAIQQDIDDALRDYGAGNLKINLAINKFYAGSDEEIVSFANHLGIEKVTALMQNRQAIASVLNNAINQRNGYLAQAGKQVITFNLVRTDVPRVLTYTAEDGFQIEPLPVEEFTPIEDQP